MNALFRRDSRPGISFIREGIDSGLKEVLKMRDKKQRVKQGSVLLEYAESILRHSGASFLVLIKPQIISASEFS
jgi:hypothetical protein